MDHTHVHDPSWIAQHITTLLTEARRQVEAAHQATGYPCVPCPACLAARDTSFQVWQHLARQNQEIERRYQKIERTSQENRQLLEELQQGVEDNKPRLLAQEVLREQYDALQEAHDALQLEYEDLQAAYYVTQQTLRQAQKGGGP